MKRGMSMKLYPKQTKILTSKTRFRVVASGRRFGKTTLGKVTIVTIAADGGACWWIAPTYGMASQVWRELKAYCNVYDDVLITEHERRIDFPGGGWLAIRSAHN